MTVCIDSAEDVLELYESGIITREEARETLGFDREIDRNEHRASAERKIAVGR